MEKPESRETGHYRSKERSVFIGFLLGLFTIFPKIVAVLIANSITLLSNLLQTCSETLGSFFSWVTLRRVAKGKTFIYNYGYGKLENLSSLVIAGAMIITFAVMIYNAIERFRSPVTVHPEWQGCGLGSILQQRLFEYARSKGLRGFTADVMAENKKMLGLIEKSGCQITKSLSSGVYEVKMLF